MPQVFFNGHAGRIEGIYTPSLNERAPVALVLHPHPLHGGDMNSKVVFTIYKALVNCGFAVLRINFRGVGRSQGKSEGGSGELNDGASALDWLKENNPDSSLNLIAGFSFGAWIAMQLIMRRPEIKNFIVASPPVNKYDFSFFSPCPCPGIIVQGDRDSIVPEENVADLANRLAKQKNTKVSYQTITGADHFFRDKLEILETIITEYLQGKVCVPEEDKIISQKLYL